MAARIERVTDDQAALLPVVRDEWLSVGLATGAADRERAQSGAVAAYREAGLERPKIFLWLGSPMAGAIGAHLLPEVLQSAGAQVWDQVGAQVRDQVRAQVGDQVRAQVGAQVGDQVRAQVGDQVGDQVLAQVWAQVGAQVRAQVWAQVWDQVRDQVWAMLYASHDAGWMSFVAFMREVLGLRKQTDKWRPLLLLSQMIGWWAPYRYIAIVQHGHSELHRDSDGRLHSESGMAVRYRDGFGVWAIHGVRVDEQVIMRPESQTIEQIHKESNEEVRRVRIERFGWERYLHESGARRINDRFNERDHQPESLYRLFDGTNRLAVSDPSTGRRYCLGVPAEIETCEQAQAWMSHGLDARAIHRS